MKNFKITFCWLTELPLKITLDGKEHTYNKREVIVQGKDVSDVLSKLKGTDVKLISNINSVLEWK